MPSKNDVKVSLNAKPKKNTTAHLLLILFGWLGIHRLYIDEKTSGVLMLALFLLSVLMLFANLGVAGFVALFFWWVLDVFTLHQRVQKWNEATS
ncbi:TM2 domain-containing protein [Alphaproteobacteria bacterium]|nr:TM2 domain-containing protein [Alphaproteobacteria bacterium]